jgi:hypothetical protein
MGLRPLPSGAFRIQDEGTWAAKAAVVDAWGLASRALTDLDLNRRGTVIHKPENHPAFEGRHDVVERFRAGFAWQADDAATTLWIPQGLTGDADGTDGDQADRGWLAVSWHNEHDEVEKGMRVSFIDVTVGANPILYRNVLLVTPVAASDTPSRHATFAAIPAHAGGALWFRNYLYIADSRGFDGGRPGGVLVFDMMNIKEVDPSRDDLIGWSAADDAYYAFGYRYVLPQVGRYVQVGADVAGRLRWSFIGLDRTNATRHLIMGEYTTSDEAPGRLVWWTLDERTGRLAAASPEHPLGASLARACSNEHFLQGCHSQDALADGTVWLTRTSGRDALCDRPITGGEGVTFQPWADQPEGLTYAPSSDNLWCVTERAGSRAVFAVKRATVSLG